MIILYSYKSCLIDAYLKIDHVLQLYEGIDFRCHPIV